MKIGLINPAWGDRRRGVNATALYRSIPPQSLLQLASLTPLDHEVSITDENWSTLDVTYPYDLVGITGTTVQIPRAYAIADEFRKRGVPVVMGGPHVSFLPHEAAMHADSIVRWEADEIWERVLKDAENHRLEKVYNPKFPQSLDFKVVRPMSRTFQIETPSWVPVKIKAAAIQAQRGCPHNCEFCSVTKFNGRRVRHKSVGYLIDEIKNAMKENIRFLLFMDDNIVADKEYAKELFHALIPLHIQWLSQTDIGIADDDVLDLAVKSGMKLALIGFESTDAETLGASISAAKKSWRAKYEDGLSKLRHRGVMVHGGFILGLDGHTHDQAMKTVEWAIENKLTVSHFTLSTPLPGTGLFRRLDKAGRIDTYDWSKYMVTECCVVKGGEGYKEALEATQRTAYREFYRFGSLLRRFNPRLSPLNQLLWLMMQSLSGMGAS
ncbi:MAG: radical SAM protein [Syntrophorhabdales bacterium]|jgi:radical SAM superfamily enzyme YgiQ (UPF0313 family)